MAGKRIKVFWRRDGRFHSDDLISFLTPQATEKYIVDEDDDEMKDEDNDLGTCQRICKFKRDESCVVNRYSM